MTTQLAETAMLVKLSIGQWSAQRQDRTVAKEAAIKHGADERSVRGYKEIIRSDSLDKYRKLADSARIYHADHTLPFEYGGVGILPARMFDEYRKNVAQIKDQCEICANEFAEDFATAREKAKDRLGTLWNSNDYPPVELVRSRFHFDVTIMPIPDVDTGWPALLGKHEATLKAEYQQQAQGWFEDASRHCWQKLYDCVEHVFERLSDEDKVFHKSLISNAQAMVELLPKMNVTNDPALIKMAEEVRLKLCSADVEGLRKDKAFRSEVAGKADDLLKRMGSYIGKG